VHEPFKGERVSGLRSHESVFPLQGSSLPFSETQLQVTFKTEILLNTVYEFSVYLAQNTVLPLKEAIS
jgi:hypothetical protein